MARDLQSTWAAVIELDVRFDQRQQYAQVQNLMHPHEKILYLSLEIRLLDARGTLNMAFPAVVTNALFRKLSSQGSFPARDFGSVCSIVLFLLTSACRQAQ